MLGSVELGKSFISWGPGQSGVKLSWLKYFNNEQMIKI